jgi:hypothetical protein
MGDRSDERNRYEDAELCWMLRLALEREARTDQNTVDPSTIAEELAAIAELTTGLERRNSDFAALDEQSESAKTENSRPVAEKSRDDSARALLEKLRDFYTACGRPQYKEIAEISERLEQLYPLKEGSKRGLPALSRSGISEVLTGRRKKLPAARWLSAFVLSCQRRGWEIGALDSDPGPTTLPKWIRLLHEAQTRRDG